MKSTESVNYENDSQEYTKLRLNLQRTGLSCWLLFAIITLSSAIPGFEDQIIFPIFFIIWFVT